MRHDTHLYTQHTQTTPTHSHTQSKTSSTACQLLDISYTVFMTVIPFVVCCGYLLFFTTLLLSLPTNCLREYYYEATPVFLSCFIMYIALPLFHFALEALSVIENGRRLVNEKRSGCRGCHWSLLHQETEERSSQHMSTTLTYYIQV